MRQETCCQCGITAPRRSFYSLNGQTYCEPCVWKASKEAKDRGFPSEYLSLKDHSLCARCGADNGTSDFAVSGNVALCPPCTDLVSDWPYPGWLKGSLAFLLILLAIALVNGKKYFRAGHDMYRGERLVSQKHYADALPFLQRTVALAPNSDKAVLLLSKAALLTGNIDVAQKALQGHNRGHFEDANNPEFQEVNTLWNRVVKAMNEADEAAKLGAQDGKSAEAAKLMHDAAASYPELPVLAFEAELLDEGAAFERQDYDSFLNIAQKQWTEAPRAETAGAVASAFACKYASTGDFQYRQKSEEMLEKARQLSLTDAEEQKRFTEYAERIQYRLKSREIITTTEFNRRFRKNTVAKD